MAETVLNEEQIRELLRRVLVELLEERKSEFYQLLVEAMEEVALAHAIQAGRKGEFVSEEEIRAILEGE